MKKYGIRLLIAFLTFSIGAGGVWFLSVFERKEYISACKGNYIVKPISPTSPDGKIEVLFKGFEKKWVKLNITNHSSKPAYYWSYSATSPFENIKFNGQEQQLFRCTSGAKQFVLESGESMTVYLSVFSNTILGEHLDETGNFQIGYYFFFDKNDGEVVWSNEFQLTESVKQEMKKELTEWRKNNEK